MSLVRRLNQSLKFVLRLPAVNALFGQTGGVDRIFGYPADIERGGGIQNYQAARFVAAFALQNFHNDFGAFTRRSGLQVIDLSGF